MGLRLVLCVLVLGACAERGLSPTSGCTRAIYDARRTLEDPPPLDLLFVVDDSASMAGEQALLAAALPEMLERLIEGDEDGDGAPDFEAPSSIHVGVVTTDLGAGPEGPDLPTCETGFGGDGILAPRCGAGPPIFELARGDDPARVCFSIGPFGCAFPQPLEAMLKALAPSSAAAPYVPADYELPVFAGGTSGHGDLENAGFVRSHSTLAVVIVADEDDCSTTDYALFHDVEPFASIPLERRCTSFPDTLQAIERYVEGLLDLRSSPSSVVFASIAGVPTDLAGSTTESFDAALADPRMEVVPGTAPLPACLTAEGDRAMPARRLVEVARGLEAAGASATVQSICASDFGPALAAVVSEIAEARAPCLPRPVERGDDGLVDCEILEVLPPVAWGLPITRCDQLDELEHAGFETDEGGETREICRLPQLTTTEAAAGDLAGWLYDESERVRRVCGPNFPPGQRITFVGHEAPSGSEVRFGCEVVVNGVDGIGAFCDPDAAEDTCARFAVPSGAPGETLACDALSASCRAPCASDDDCLGAGLLGHTCDLRASESGAPRAVCVSPTCG